MEKEIRNKQVYNIIASEFSNSRINRWFWIDDFLKQFNKESTILDIGCGNGRNMTFPNLNFIGVDNCSNFIKICKDRHLNALNCDMCNIPLPEHMFDGIISIASFHHLCNLERRKLSLLEMKRMLKNNGKILLSIWSIDQSHNRKLNFNYGDNYIPWKNKDGSIKENRYYYIFKLEEIKLLIQEFFIIEKYFWNHGNDIFILKNI